MFQRQREEGDPGRGTDSSVPGGAAALHTEPRAPSGAAGP